MSIAYREQTDQIRCCEVQYTASEYIQLISIPDKAVLCRNIDRAMFAIFGTGVSRFLHFARRF